MPEYKLTRRAALVAATAGAVCRPWVARAVGQEIVHWSWLAASDGEVWQKMIDNFNSANKDVQIKMELVPEEQYTTKVLAAAATGRAPDFGWGTAGQRAKMAKDGVVVPLDDLYAHICKIFFALARGSRNRGTPNELYRGARFEWVVYAKRHSAGRSRCSIISAATRTGSPSPTIGSSRSPTERSASSGRTTGTRNGARS